MMKGPFDVAHDDLIQYNNHIMILCSDSRHRMLQGLGQCILYAALMLGLLQNLACSS